MITGSLPGNWSTAESLEEINLSYNFLQDELPDSWADLEELRYVVLEIFRSMQSDHYFRDLLLTHGFDKSSCFWQNTTPVFLKCSDNYPDLDC